MSLENYNICALPFLGISLSLFFVGLQLKKNSFKSSALPLEALKSFLAEGSSNVLHLDGNSTKITLSDPPSVSMT